MKNPSGAAENNAGGQRRARAGQSACLPPLEITRNAHSLTFWVKVRPRSSRERMSRDVACGEIRLEVHAPPSGGEANEASRKLVAKSLAVPVSAVTIVTGEKNRRKLIRVECESPEAVVRLKKLCEPKSS